MDIEAKKGDPDVNVGLNGEETRKFKSSAAFRIAALAKVRAVAAKAGVPSDGEIMFIAGPRTGPLGPFPVDSDGVFPIKKGS